MNMAQLVFHLIAVSGILYFLFRKRVFDFLSLGYLSSVIYFLPGFFGHSTYKVQGEFIKLELLPETYIVMSVVMGAILTTGALFDMRPRHVTKRRNYRARYDENVGLLLLLIGILSLLLLAVKLNFKMLIIDKANVMGILGRAFIAYNISTSLSMVIFFIQKRFRLFIISILFMSISISLGMRSPLAFSFISIMTATLMQSGSLRLGFHKRIILCSLILASAMFIYGAAGASFRHSLSTGDWSLFLDNISSNDFIVRAITQSEPFGIQSILNEVLREHFTVPTESLIGLVKQFTVLSPEMGLSSIGFNDYFQPYLFPKVTYGMANNIWAHVWSVGGWWLLILFILSYSLFLMLLSWVAMHCEGTLKAFLVLFSVPLSFYIHRNDLFYQLTLERRYFLCYILALAICQFSTVLLRKKC